MINTDADLRDTLFVLFGAGGDLSWRLIVPALLWDVMIGDATLFMSAAQVEEAWRLLMPMLQVWEENPAPDFPNYSAGSWGPQSAETLIAGDGKSWLTPTLERS